ncbi:MAG: hypothetical protein ACP5VE_06110, partial [Chthonomonadales bacterium]
DRCHRQYLNDWAKCVRDYQKCTSGIIGWIRHYWCAIKYSECMGWAWRHQDECYKKRLEED